MSFYTLALVKPARDESKPPVFARSGIVKEKPTRALEEAEVLAHQLAIKGFGYLEVRCFVHATRQFPEHGQLVTIAELRRMAGG